MPTKTLMPEPNPPSYSPRDRLKEALESRRLNLTGISHKTYVRKLIKPPFLACHIEYAMQGGSVSAARAANPYLFPPSSPRSPRFTELLLYRDEIIGTDEVASQADFDEAHWTLEHVLGWIAHRNPRRFREIAPIDSLDPSTHSSTQRDMQYAFDFRGSGS